MGTLEKFNLKSLGTMDGERIAIAFEQELKRVDAIVADLKRDLPKALVVCCD